MKEDVPEPHVGIFWLIGQRMVIDTIPISKARKYGGCKIYEGDHISQWSEMQKRGEVPPETEYEALPRGRVTYKMKTQRFSLMADACILGRQNIVRRLMSAMHLPNDSALSTDEHYRCFRCLA